MLVSCLRLSLGGLTAAGIVCSSWVTINRLWAALGAHICSCALGTSGLHKFRGDDAKDPPAADQKPHQWDGSALVQHLALLNLDEYSVLAHATEL